MLIARLIAEPDSLSENLQRARQAMAADGLELASASMLDFCGDVLQLGLPGGDSKLLRDLVEAHFRPSDALITDHEPVLPRVFISDMDSTIISAECIDELADFAGIKAEVAAITERAMQGEIDFAGALRERVGLLRDLPETAIAECLETRIEAMPGARTLVATLKAKGCRTVLVTGGFHHFADTVAEQIGFDHVVGNRLEVAGGKLTGRLVGAITDSSVKRATLIEEIGKLGDGATSLATGDGANDIPMLEAATYGIAYHAKPKARAAGDGWIDRGNLTAVLQLFGIPREEWVRK